MADSRFYTKTAPRKLADLAALCGASLLSPAQADVLVHDVAALDSATQGTLSFLDNPKYKAQLSTTKASAVLVRAADAALVPAGVAALVAADPYRAYALIAAQFYPNPKPTPLIHVSAVVDPTAHIGQGTVIGACAVIGAGVVVGENCDIGPNCVISHTLMGNHVRVLPGAKIGQDGFGFALSPQGHLPVPQLGRVVIGNHVTIGANTCIDRGAGPDTEIGDGTVIDNLVQIAHNVKIGRNCVVVSQVGISGSTVLQDFVVLAGQAGIAGHLTIGAGARVSAQSGVSKDLEGRQDYAGSPAMPAREHWKQLAALKNLLSKRSNKG